MVAGRVVRVVESGTADGPYDRHRVVDRVDWQDCWIRTLVNEVEVRWAHWNHQVGGIGRRWTSRSYAMQD